MGRRRRDDRLWASELAQFTRCEQKALFERGKNVKRSHEETRRLRDGAAVHAALHRDAISTDRRVDLPTSDRRCFIASAVYGPDAPETQMLRILRNLVFLRSRFGARLVGLYYELSPSAARWLERRPWARALVRRVLDRLLRLTGV
jgi:hypothetical protein